MITVVPLLGGRLIEADNDKDAKIVTKFSHALHRYGDNPTKKNKRRAKAAWLQVENNLRPGDSLPRSAGISREEIFGEGTDVS